MRNQADADIDWAATVAAQQALGAKAADNKLQLAALAQQAKDIANGTTAMSVTLVGLGALLKKVCEMEARLYFDAKFGDP